MVKDKENKEMKPKKQGNKEDLIFTSTGSN